MTLSVIYCILLAVIAFRIMLFTRFGVRKPIISWLAYLVMIAALIKIIMIVMCQSKTPEFTEVIIAAALALAMVSHHGNLAELFKATADGPRCLRWLSYTPKKRKKEKTNSRVTPKRRTRKEVQNETR